MPSHIGQCFLHDTEQRQLDVGSKTANRLSKDINVYPTALAKSLNVPLQGRNETRFIMQFTSNPSPLFILDPEELSCQMKKLFFRLYPIGDVLTYCHHRSHRTVRGQFGNDACPVVSATIFNGSMDRFLFVNRLIAARFKVLPNVILERD